MRFLAALAALLAGVPPAIAGGRLGAAPLKAPVLAPTLSAPVLPALTPGGLLPKLAVPSPALPSAAALASVALPAPSIARPVTQAPAAVSPEPAKPPIMATLSEGAERVQTSPEGAQAASLETLFSGSRMGPVNAVSGAEAAAGLEARLAPMFAEEAALTAGRMARRELSSDERRDIVARTKVVHVGLWKHIFNEFGVMASYPDGVARDDLSIELTRRDPRRLPDAEAYYRVLFAHEYTHRLQFEGDVARNLGIEIPPVAVELLRGIELVGLDALKAGRIPFVTPNVLQGFESGRAWARDAAAGKAAEGAFYYKGALAGAAWELAQRTGRPADAWEFVRRVSSQKRPEAPAAVYADIAGR